MNHIVNRESIGMRTFATASYSITEELSDTCSILTQELYDAKRYMQDESGQEAISIVENLVQETLVATNYIRTLAENINKSAKLLEESDNLL